MCSNAGPSILVAGSIGAFCLSAGEKVMRLLMFDNRTFRSHIEFVNALYTAGRKGVTRLSQQGAEQCLCDSYDRDDRDVTDFCARFSGSKAVERSSRRLNGDRHLG